ncbi:MAG TPA: PepSY domain-containing protein [Vicinamibacterales bacterium]|nr:PepSY domain-containing protein [Vicinamibacterales bacterium]
MKWTIALIAAFMLATLNAYAQTTYKKDIPSALAKEAKVDEATAAAAARARVPNGTIRSVELEREKGRLIYSYDFTVTGKKGVEEVNVDAASGKVVATEHESAATERTEAAKEATAKKGTKKP